jgi:hypothetical protein
MEIEKAASFIETAFIIFAFRRNSGLPGLVTGNTYLLY